MDPLLRRAILPARDDEESLGLESVSVVSGSLDRHPESVRDRAQARVVARAHLVEEEHLSALSQVSEDVHPAAFLERIRMHVNILK